MGWFADALRQVMTEQKLSVGSVARKLETSPSLVRKWRAGTAVPSVERAAQIADALHVSYERLCLPGGPSAAAFTGLRVKSTPRVHAWAYAPVPSYTSWTITRSVFHFGG